MGCSSSDTLENFGKIIKPVDVRVKYHYFHKQMRFNNIKQKDILNNEYNPTRLSDNQYHNGYRMLIENSFLHLNTAFKGAFETTDDRDKMIVQYIYLFFSDNTDRKIHEAKVEFLKNYFEVNINKPIFSYYSILALPRALNFMLMMVLVPVFLPKEAEDLDFFFGGFPVDGYHGSQYQKYIKVRLSKIFPLADFEKAENNLRDLIDTPEIKEYYDDMMQRESKNLNLKPKQREILVISEKLIKMVIIESMKFFDHLILYDNLVGTNKSAKTNEIKETKKHKDIEHKDKDHKHNDHHKENKHYNNKYENENEEDNMENQEMNEEDKEDDNYEYQYKKKKHKH